MQVGYVIEFDKSKEVTWLQDKIDILVGTDKITLTMDQAEVAVAECQRLIAMSRKVRT